MADILRRTTLMVRHADTAAAWFETVFGMTRWMDTPFILSGTQLAAGQAGDRTRLVIMKAADDHIGMVGLLEWLQPTMQAPAVLPRRIEFGAPIFVMAATDCRATTERARTVGSHIYCEPHEWDFTGPDGRTRSMLGASFFDLDGYFFEVNQALA